MASLARLALPSLAQIALRSATGVLDMFFVSFLGTDALAGVSLVFPVFVLMFTVAGVAIGGGVASAVARALGARRVADAEALALHGVVIALGAGALFTAVVIGFGRPIYRALGGSGAALDAAVLYSDIVFGGAVVIWLANALTAVLQGSGDTVTPARIAWTRTLWVLPLSPLLIFGWGPVPSFGVAGAAVASVVNAGLGLVALALHLRSHRSTLRLRWRGIAVQARWFGEILRVGGLAAIQMTISNLTLVALTGLVGGFGAAALAGYGLAMRLEMVLMPMLSSLGVATATLVGLAFGSGRLARARRITWTSALLGAALLETAGLLAALLAPRWIGLFSAEPAVIAAGTAYLRIVGPFLGAAGLMMMLFFASQGWGRMAVPLFTAALRMTLIVGGGWVAIGPLGADLSALYGMVVAATVIAGAVLALLIWQRVAARVDA